MPVDRLLHPRIGDSEKIATLTDLEFRVWIAYLLAADDFGVLPMLAAKIQAIDRTLSNRKRLRVDRALATLVDVGLVEQFDHQGQMFIFSKSWQTHQRIRHPRRTYFPKPPDSLCQICDSVTQELLAQHTGPNGTSTYEESSGKITPNGGLARARTPETANGKRLTANGKRQEAKARFDRWWAEYPRKVGKDAAWEVWLRRAPGDDLTDQMIAKVREQRVSRDWTKDHGQFIPHPRTWLKQGRWQDQGPDDVPPTPDWHGHVPHCRNQQECVKRFLDESKVAAS